jgi:hypothetical protein
MHVNYQSVENSEAKYLFAKTLRFLAHELEPMPPKAKSVFAEMWLAKWLRWRPRYIKLASLAAGHAVSHLFCPPMRWWERELFAAQVMRASRPMDTAPIN